MENGLIIFVRNLEKGKVKSRLAKDIGDDKALEVYQHLLTYTADVSLSFHCNRFVFYSSYIHLADSFDDHCFTKLVQEGEDLGERMKNAFKEVFRMGTQKACIIGSDCNELSPEILQQAFTALDDNQVVVGPSSDGGYYLLGMKKLHEDLFNNKEWGTDSVLDDTIQFLNGADLSYIQLPELNDIDTMEDLLKTNILTQIEEEESDDIADEIEDDAEL